MKRRAFSLVELIVALAILGILIALMLPAVQRVRESSRGVECRSHLHQVGLAIGNYISVHKMYPPGGSKGMSLHVFLLPHLDQQSLYNSLNFAADDIDDEPLRTVPVPLYFCPSDPAAAWRSDPRGGYGTNYAGNYGSGLQKFGYNGVFRHLHSYIDPVYGAEGPIREGDIRDGASNTVAVAEILVGNGQPAKLRTLWSTPGGKRTRSEQFEEFADLCRSLLPEQSLTPNPWNRGRPWTLGDAGFTLYNHILTPNQNSCTNSGAVQEGAYSAASLHSGGVHALFADGHVVFVSDNIDTGAWRAQGSRNGGEVFE